MAETTDLEGDRFSTMASQVIEKWQSAHPGVKVAGHEAANLEDFIADALRETLSETPSDGCHDDLKLALKIECDRRVTAQRYILENNRLRSALNHASEFFQKRAETLPDAIDDEECRLVADIEDALMAYER